MKIVPYTKKWNEGERDWSYVEDPRVSIECWEKINSLKLPEDYRKFINKFNGGRVYPRLFKHNVGSLNVGPYTNESCETYVDLIFPWDTVESIWRGEMYGVGVPSEHLVIAESPGAIHLLLSLSGDSYGKIFVWPHSNEKLGTERNPGIYLQSESFSLFLASLYDDRERSDFDNWRLPIYDKLQKDLVL